MDRNSKEFKDLQSTWYAKLEKDGFEDIEQSEDILKIWNRLRYDNVTTTISAISQYYRLAGHFLHDFQFESELDKFVWEHHAQGLTVRDIAKLAGEAGFKKKHKSQVDRTIIKLRKEMLKNVRKQK